MMQPKILLVDDREDNLLSIETILSQDGYQFVKASSGIHALKILLNQFDFALILMDVRMPNLNGFETAALIYEREKLKNIPIIFITANYYGDENIFKGYKAGALDYIYKPINPELLRAKVAVFVELYKKNYSLRMQEQKLIAINKNLEIEIRDRQISEQKVQELNRKLLENITRLESANKDLDQFAFMASHDLQEPLRKIQLFSERLLLKFNNDLDTDAVTFINSIQRASNRMQLLIKDILTFSKITSEEKSFEETDFNELLNEVISEMEDEIKEKKAQILVEQLPVLKVNPGLIKPLFYNIVNNALKYSKKDIQPVVRIHSENNKNYNIQEGKFCRIFIEDNGIGFEQKYAEQIFGMFKRLHTKTEFEGTGIGLALCKKIVEEHNGYISARGTINEGSTFIISLPYQQPEKKELKNHEEELNSNVKE
jgi:signal transduction histidine kinase